MAFVVQRPKGVWELRSSIATPKGPRSRTLVSFRSLSADAVEQAVERSGGSLTPAEVRTAARRAGAPVALAATRQAAADLSQELSRGGGLPESWRRPLRDLLAGSAGDPDSAADAEAIADWAGADPARRGEALRQLLLLADAIGNRTRPGELAFPGLSTGSR